MKYNNKEYRRMPDWWKTDKAIAHAKSIGLDTQVINGDNYIEDRWRPAWVSFDTTDFIPYRAWLQDMDDWNGWMQPFMTVDELERLRGHEVPESECGFFKRFDKFVYVYYEDVTELEPATITVDGKEIAGYHVGLGLCWVEVTEEEIVERVATEFGQVLYEWLKPEQFKELRERNATLDDSSCCYSHDYCDANMAMDEAFKRLFGRGMAFGDDDTNQEHDLWLSNTAWAKAKENNFRTL